MSMIVTTLIPEGIVMAADSAASVFKMVDMVNFSKGNYSEAVMNTINRTCAPERENVVGHNIISRSICKLHVMKGNNIAFVEGNQRGAGAKSFAPYMDHFCNTGHFDNPKDCAVALFNYIKSIRREAKAEYYVCGYNSRSNIPFPECWYIDIEGNNVTDAAMGQYGMNVSGANTYFFQYATLINKNITSYSLQDAIDVSLFAIDMSIKLERFIDREEHISPPIDLLVIKPSGVEWIHQKPLKVEDSYGFVR